MNHDDQSADHAEHLDAQAPEGDQAQNANSEIPTLPAPMASYSTSDEQPAPPEPQPTSNLYHPEDSLEQASDEAYPVDLQMQDNGKQVSWTALEFVEHDKTQSWYLSMVGISVVVVAAVYFITKDLFNAFIIVIAAVLFGVVAGRAPRHMDYMVNGHGVAIGRRFYPYSEFRSFSIADEGHVRSIVLMPLKRFMPSLTLYFDPADEQRIGDVLADHLPFAQYQRELTDRLMRRIRF